MNTQNMKLLDLETGNYLKLGKDFYYGGDGIMIHCYTEEELTDFEELPDFKPNQYIDYDHNDDTKYKKTIKNGFDKAMYDGEAVKLWIEYKSEPQLELKEICEKVGAVVYGGRYVLMMSFEYQNKEIKVGDIITAQTITTSKDSISMKQYANQIVCFRGNTAFEHSGYNMGFVICENLKCFGINGFWKHRAFDYEERKLEINFNFFEEYSKQLRNEPNKFDELKELLK